MVSSGPCVWCAIQIHFCFTFICLQDNSQTRPVDGRRPNGKIYVVNLFHICDQNWTDSFTYLPTTKTAHVQMH